MFKCNGSLIALKSFNPIKLAKAEFVKGEELYVLFASLGNGKSNLCQKLKKFFFEADLFISLSYDYDL